MAYSKRLHSFPTIPVGRRTLSTLLGMIAMLFAAASGFSLIQARDFQNQIIQKAVTSAGSMSDDIDREVEASRSSLSVPLPRNSLEEVAARQRLPTNWGGAIVDRNGTLIAKPGTAEIPKSPIERALLKSRTAPEAYFTSHGGDGSRAAYAFSRSRNSDYVSLIKLPLAEVQAPVTRTVYQIEFAGIALALGCVLAFALLSREAAVPLDDMTKRAKSSEAELRSANAHLRTVLASISDCYLTLDSEYRVTDFNEAMLHWLGRNEESVVGRLL